MSNIVAMPAEKTKKQLLWLTNNLRTHDAFYWQHISPQDQVVAVFCIEPTWLQPTRWGWKKMGVHRARFMLETLADLQQQLATHNIILYVYMASAAEIIPLLYRQFSFDTIIAQQHWTSEEQQLQSRIQQVLPQVSWLQSYERFLIQPQHLPFALTELPQVFTQFRVAVEAQLTVLAPLTTRVNLQQRTTLTATQELPTLADLGYSAVATDPRSAFPFLGGERAALAQVQQYLWGSNHILQYKDTRNGLIGTDYSSKFSPWLANGSLSVRTLYQQLRQFESEVAANQSTYWLFFELLWRDYFSYISLTAGNRIFTKGGIKAPPHNHSLSHTPSLTRKWVQGRTQYDFVNANMLELALTGWMSNRGRQNVASYWAKELQQDWRVGASYFESMLIDYDVHANYGNWSYIAGVGNDPRNRVFNITGQAQRYDPKAEYRTLWLSNREHLPHNC